MELQEIEMKITDEMKYGVFAISLVDKPAIEEDFIKLSVEEVQLKVLDEEKRIVVGFALVPEKRIYRRKKDKEFYIYFTKETIAKTQELFMRKLNLSNFTLDHKKKAQGVSVIESWIVEDPKNDKSNIYNLNAKGGEWVLMSKVYNDDIWKEIKEGKFKGYSIEGKFDDNDELKQSDDNEELINEIKEFLRNA
jgi:hypothetical protein